MINEYPIDVNFCIAVRPPVPTVIYSHSIEMGVAKLCLLYFLQTLLMAFPEASRRWLLYHHAHARELGEEF